MDYNDRIIFKIGLGVIIFLAMLLVRVVYPGLKKNYSKSANDSVLRPYLYGFMIWLISTVAFSIYINATGLIILSAYVLFKVALINLAPPLILSVYDKITELKHQNESLQVERKLMQKRIDKKEGKVLNQSVEFISENQSDYLSLLVNEILFIKSANNYAEINYLEGDRILKKLVRNTLKNIELLLKPYPEFIRCHRVCIVNIRHIEKLVGNCNHHTLIIKGSEEAISVSRQYYLKMKEALLSV